MKNLLIGVLVLALPALSMAEQLEAERQVRALVEAFNTAYATNDVEGYFGHYAEDAELYFFGARQDVDAYHLEWKALMAAGGGVKKNEISDLKIQVMPGGKVAIVTYFVENETVYPGMETSRSRAFESDVWRKRNGNWKIVNLHFSEIAEPASPQPGSE